MGPVVVNVVWTIIHPHFVPSLISALGFIAYSIPYGLVLSTPSFLILLLICYLINRYKIGLHVKKILLSTIALILAVLPFIIIFSHDDSGIDKDLIAWLSSYGIVIVSGIWFYRLPLSIHAKQLTVNE
jgi:hypothetical protein